MSNKDAALEAIRAAEDVCHEAWLKLLDVIAFRRARGKDVSAYTDLRTRALRRMQIFTQIRHDLEVAENVARAPSPEEIAAVQALLVKVRKISIQQAATGAGLKLINDGKKIIDALNEATKGIKAA